MGLPADLACEPHRHQARHDQGPEAGKAVSEFEGVGNELFGGLQRDPEGGAEGGGGVLVDQGCAGSRERDDAVVVTVVQPQPAG